MITQTTMQHMMGFYLAVGLSLAVLPGIVMARDGRAVHLRRAGQALVAFSAIMLAISAMRPV
jgi:hypothetical protein